MKATPLQNWEGASVYVKPTPTPTPTKPKAAADKIFSGGFLSDISDILNIPQYAATAIATNKNPLTAIKTRYTPSKALGWEDSLKGIAADIILDPTNLLGGSGLLKGFKKIDKIKDVLGAGKAADKTSDIIRAGGRIDDVEDTVRAAMKGEKAVQKFGNTAEGIAAKLAPNIGEQILNPSTLKKGEKYIGSVNINRLDIDKNSKGVIKALYDDVVADLARNYKGSELTHEDITKEAWRIIQNESWVATKVITKKDTQKIAGMQTALRQLLAGKAAEGKLTKEFVDLFTVVDSWAADAGRRLNAFKIIASPEYSGAKMQIFKRLKDLGHDTQTILKAAEGVDFNNAKQATAFFRQFVKPTTTEIIKELRYINLLSSVKTHVVNAVSNALQTFATAPATKLASGAIDTVASKLTGKAREYYIREVPAYYRGAMNAVGEAGKAFSEAMKGNIFIERPDLARFATNKLPEKIYSIPRLLEAGDVYFRTLIKAGEKEALAYRAARAGKEVAEEVLDKEATEKAAYYVFRKLVDPQNKTGQGKLLSFIDDFTNIAYKVQRNSLGSFIVPFVATPMNILKQMIELSPAGLLTLTGNTKKTEQLAKALVGSTVMATTSWLAHVGDATMNTPKSEKEKRLWYATGRQPYSIRIGDTWVDFSRLGAVSFPMALAATLKYRMSQEPASLTKTKSQQIQSVLGDVGKYFSQQTYVEAIGDLIDAFDNQPGGWEKLAANVPRQMIPLSSLIRWANQVVDDIYRKPESLTESLMADIPGLSKTLLPYTDPRGEPSRRPYPLINAISPAKLSPVNETFESQYQVEQAGKRYGSIDTVVSRIRKEVEEIARISPNYMSQEEKQRRIEKKTEELNEIFARHQANINPR